MFRYASKLLYRTDLSHLCKGRLLGTDGPKEKWDLITAVCLERKPVITKQLNSLELEYKQMLSAMEFERSLKSDHEMRHEKEVKQLDQLKKGNDVDVHFIQTAQDLLDLCTEELSQFTFGSRTTEADKRNDLKSLKRKLDQHLVLVVNQKIGDRQCFLLPQSLRKEGETLRQTAERLLKEYCGSNIKAQIYGNAPSSFYKYKYPKSIRNETVGAKVFIYFARYLNGELPNKGIDYLWLDRKELSDTLPENYKESVLDMLIDEK